MNTAIAFKNEIEKVYSLTYSIEDTLSSSTVVKENLIVTYDDTPVTVNELFYYPTKNLMIMSINAIDSTDCEYATIAGNGITDTDANPYTLDGKAALTRVADPSYDGVSVTAIYYKSAGVPIFNLIGKSNVTAMVRITNTTSSPAEKTITVYDGEELIGQQAVNIAADDFTEIAILLSGHTFINNKANIEIQ